MISPVASASTPGHTAADGVGTAGRTGPDVRSDLQVRVEPGRAGTTIEIRSRVASLYGESIRRTVEATLAALGVSGVHVTVDDHGAVPWVIAARVEAAVRDAGLIGTQPAGNTADTVSGGGVHSPADHDGERETLPRSRLPRLPSPRDRLRRSRLYVPGGEPKFMLNAGLHRPDGVILDLEDSVHPAHKDAARLLVRNALRMIDFAGAERMVRINQHEPGLVDVDAIVPEQPNMVLIPKAEHADQLRAVQERIAAVRSRLGIADAPPIWLMPIIETALGVEHAFSIAAATNTVAAITIGLEDYTADLGVAKTRDGAESLWARQRIVNAARAAGVQAIDSVYGNVDDAEGLLAWAERARAMGFSGMGCVHPRQIGVIHRAFRPTAEEIQRAQQIVDAFADAQHRGLGVVSLGSRMIDPPVVLRAHRLIEHVREIDLLGGGGDA
jgi:citrate lyase subunit beta / citryl-CoA lyase